MVRDYAVDYYAPSAESARAVVADDFAGARGVAAFRRRIESQWPSVAVEQVDGSGLPDTPEIGATISLKAKVRLGGLSVSDVEVQAVLGRVSPGEELTDVVTFPMTHFGTEDGTEDGAEIFEAEVALPVSGSVGYTVRVLPHHRLLVDASELGLVTSPSV